MKLLIISGGSKGLGSALCDHYLSRDFSVIEFSRTTPYPFSMRVDLSLASESVRVIRESIIPLASKEWQEIVVINNAGVLNPIGPASKKDTPDVLDNININFTSGLLFMAEALKHFQNHGGKKTLVNISSGAAVKGYPGWSLYCAAKAGLENFISSIALEQESEEFPFAAINIDPGLIDTDMQASIRQSNVEDFPAIELFIQRKETGLLKPAKVVAEKIIEIVSQPSIENGKRYSI